MSSTSMVRFGARKRCNTPKSRYTLPQIKVLEGLWGLLLEGDS